MKNQFLASITVLTVLCFTQGCNNNCTDTTLQKDAKISELQKICSRDSVLLIRNSKLYVLYKNVSFAREYFESRKDSLQLIKTKRKLSQDEILVLQVTSGQFGSLVPIEKEIEEIMKYGISK